MTGALNIYDAIVKHLPTSLLTEENASVSIRWQPRRSLPRDQPQTYPRGVIEILASNPLPRVRGPGGVNSTDVTQADAFAFATGTLAYGLSQWDAQSITSVVSGATTYAAGTDYVLTDRKTFSWTSGGSKPANGASFTVTYKHRLYQRRWEGRSHVIVRAILLVKDATVSGREYPKEALAAVLGEALEHHLRRYSGRVLSKPVASPGTSTPMTAEAMAGPVLASRVGVTDESESVAAWVCDFRVYRNRAFLDDAVEGIKTVDFTETFHSS